LTRKATHRPPSVSIPTNGLRNVYGIMLGNTCIDDAMVDTAIDGLKLIPATVDLSAIEVKLSEADGRQ